MRRVQLKIDREPQAPRTRIDFLVRGLRLRRFTAPDALSKAGQRRMPVIPQREYQIIFTISGEEFGLNAAWIGRGCFMIYKGVESHRDRGSLRASEMRQFRIGERVVAAQDRSQTLPASPRWQGSNRGSTGS